MTTSGSYDFNLTRNEIIETAYRNVGGLSDGNTLSPEQYANASILLNAMVKNWTADDIFLWELEYKTYSLTASSVVLGSDGSDYQCIRNHTSSASTLPVTGSEYTGYWKKLSTSAGGAWVTATAYTSINNIALESSVISVDQMTVRETGTSISDVSLSIINREAYYSLGDATSEGKPTQYYFDKQTTPEIFLYPYPSSTTQYTINVVLYRYIQDFDTGANTPDILQEWISPLIDGLAVELAPSRGISGDMYTQLLMKARSSKNIARGSNKESGNTQFAPRFR